MTARARPARPALRLGFVTLVGASALVAACGWDPSRPFEREAPQVREAIAVLDGGDAAIATDILTDYLTTGACKEGNIGTPPRVRARPNGSFDLGLALFRIAESFGHRFGEEELDASVLDSTLKAQRSEQVECAGRIVTAIAEDETVPADLRARAHYLQGNLQFLNGAYEDAVRAYDKALEIAPGMGDAGPFGASDASVFVPDEVGRDAAYNRAIALRRIEDKKDAGDDASNDAGGDGQSDASDSGEAGSDSGQNEGGKNDEPDSGKDGGSDDQNPDGGKDSGAAPDSGQNDENKPPEPEPQTPDAAPPPPSKQNQDERMLDQLENAPTVQQEAARKNGQRRRVRGMSDK